MKVIVAIWVGFVGLVGAAHAEYRASAPLQLQGKDVFQRIVLPMEVYRDARRDLADVRVLNGKGEAVPMAFAGQAEPERETPVVATLPQFPVTTRTATTAGGGRVDVSVRTRPDGTLVSVQERPGKVAATRPVAYLLDASQIKFPVGALQFDWEATPGSEVVKVSVETGDDLREWRPAASRAPLVRVQQGGQSLSQTRVEMAVVRAKYFRVTWDAAPFGLKSVEAISAPEVKPPERKVSTFNSVERTNDGDFVFDLGARLPVELVRVVFPEPNSVAPYEISARDAPNAWWRPIGAATFHRIVRDGVELVSVPLAVGRHTERYWKLKPGIKDASSSGAAPSLEVHWRPAEIVFVAKGEGPFVLAFADPEARPAALPIASLIPNYERGAESKVALAATGAVAGAPPATGVRSLLGDVEPKRAALWGMLILGVLFLAGMAWSLKRQMTK